MTYQQFDAKWEARFAPNDQFLISATDLREFKDDILLVFGVTVANVPTYVAGTTYAEGFLVRYSQAGGRESFYYALQAGQLPHPTYNQSDANWKIVPGPVAETVISQAITLLEAQGIDGNGVVSGRRYGILGQWNGRATEELVEVDGLENYFRHRGTLVRDDATQLEVEVDVIAATYAAVPSGGGAGIPRVFQLTSTGTNAYADLLVSVPAARLESVDGYFNAGGLQAQVLTPTGLAYRPYRDTPGNFNDDLSAFWTEFAPPVRPLLRLRSVATSQALVSHSLLTFTVPPATVPQLLHGHDNGFRLFGNQFTMAPYSWNHAQQCSVSGNGTIVADGSYGASSATGSPALSNTGTGLRFMFTCRHNGAASYDRIGFTAAQAPNPQGGNFSASFFNNIDAGGSLETWLGSTKRVQVPITQALLSLEVSDDGIRWYVGGAQVDYEPNPPAEAQLWLGATFYYQGGGFTLVQAGAQTTTPR